MQSVSSRIWTRVSVSICYDDNLYTTGTFDIKKDWYVFKERKILSLCYLLSYSLYSFFLTPVALRISTLSFFLSFVILYSFTLTLSSLSLLIPVAEVFQRDILVFIIYEDHVCQTSIDLIKENRFTLKKERSRWYPAETIADADYADEIVLLANTPTKAESLLHSVG